MSTESALLDAAVKLLAARKAMLVLLSNPATGPATPEAIDGAQEAIQAAVAGLEFAVKTYNEKWCPICTTRHWTQIASRHVKYGDYWWCPTHLAYVKSERG